MKYVIWLVLLIGCNPNQNPRTNSGAQKDSVRTGAKIVTESSLHQVLVSDLNGDKYRDTIKLFSVKGSKQFCIVMGSKKGEFCFGEGSNNGILDHSLNWIDTMFLVNDSILFSQVFLENGDVDLENYDSVVVDFPSISLGQHEGGGGIVYWKDGKFNWVHQAD